VNICAETQQPGVAPTREDPRWNAVVARDPAADGRFFYSVKTTGVYCFPSCAGRLPNPENVRFHRTREEAEQAGFRPCKRCKPDQGGGQRQRAAREIRFAFGESTLGLVLVAQSPDGLCSLMLGDDREELQRELERRFPYATLVEDAAGLAPLVAQMTACVEAPGSGPDVPLDLGGTEFQQRVWQALREVAPNYARERSEVARRIGLGRSAPADASGAARNEKS